MTKIVLIGAGSVVFGVNILRDLYCARRELQGSTLVLVDIDRAALARMQTLALHLNQASAEPFVIEATDDRAAALPGADFVIISFAVNRYALWRQDFQIPLKHGVRQVLGENGGPGGLFHAMRNVPLLLAICRDIERFCPHALVLNFSNPEGRLCQAAARYTQLQFVGLCHGIFMAQTAIGRVLDLPVSDILPRAAGLNHFTWILELCHASTGRDLYEPFRRALKEHGIQEFSIDVEPSEASAGASKYVYGMTLSRYLMDTFGLWPSPSDDHVGEYLSYAWEFCGLKGYDFDWAQRRVARREQRLVGWTNGQLSLDSLLSNPSGERAIPIILGVLGTTHQHELSVNVPNHGCISNLPDWAVVEVPGTVDAAGVHGDLVGALPNPIAAMCTTQIAITDCAIQAAVEGSRRLALEALLLDPLITSAGQAEAIFDEFLQVQKDYLPQFA